MGGRKQLVFSDKGGQEIQASFRPQFAGENVSAETFPTKALTIERIRPEISPQTCRSRWEGGAMDYDIAVQALMNREERSLARGIPPD